MTEERADLSRNCRVCGGAMGRTGIERVGRDATRLGKGPYTSAVQEQLVCESCKTIDWVPKRASVEAR